ncbi:MAG: hypothetical protein V1820_01000 [archaeon]
MENSLEKLLKEQNFTGKNVCIFPENPEIEDFLKKRMAGKIVSGALETQSDFVISWLYPKAESAQFLRESGKSLKAKGKLIFLFSGKERRENLKDWFWKYGFMITRHFFLSITRTDGISYASTGKKKEDFLFLVAEKIGGD